jgi:hypothetical protein
MSSITQFLNDQKKSSAITSSIIIGLGGISTFFLMKKLYLVYKELKYKYPARISYTSDLLSSDVSRVQHGLVTLLETYPHECTLTLKSKNVIILNSIEAIKKFSKQQNDNQLISNRPKNDIFSMISNEYLGSFFRMNDDKLNEKRKFSSNTLHSLMGKTSNFDKQLDFEIKQFIDFLTDKSSLDDFPVYLQQSSANLLTTLGLNVRFDYETSSNTPLKQQIKAMTEIFASLDIIQISDFDTSDKGTVGFLTERLDTIYGFLQSALNEYAKNSFKKGKFETFADYVITNQSEKLEKLKVEIFMKSYLYFKLFILKFVILLRLIV